MLEGNVKERDFLKAISAENSILLKLTFKYQGWSVPNIGFMWLRKRSSENGSENLGSFFFLPKTWKFLDYHRNHHLVHDYSPPWNSLCFDEENKTYRSLKIWDEDASLNLAHFAQFVCRLSVKPNEMYHQRSQLAVPTVQHEIDARHIPYVCQSKYK